MEISAEEQIRLLESVVRSANDAVMITEPAPLDEPGPRILYVNEAFTRMTGYAGGEAVGRSPRFLQGPETSSKARARIRSALERQEPVRVELLNYRKDGAPFWVDVNIVPIRDSSGEVTHFASIQRDTTSRREAEQTARLLAETEAARADAEESRQQLATLLDSLTDAFFSIDRQWRLTFLNPRAREILGPDAEKLLGGEIWELFPELVGSDFERCARQVMASRRPASIEMYATRFEAWLEIRMHPTANGLSLTGRDVSARKRAEQALRQAHEETKAMVRGSPLAIIRLDARGKIRMWNPAAERLFGWKQHEVQGTPPPFFPPEREAEAREAHQLAREGKTLTGVVTERLRKDGSRVQVSLSTAPLGDEAVHDRGVLLVLEDITARREAEATQQRLTAILEATSDIVATTDPRGRLLYLNRTGREVWGLREEDVRGRALPALLPDWAAKVLLDEAIPAAMREGIWRGELAVVAADGREVPVSKVLIAHRRADGEVEYLSMVNRDISDLKRIEQIQTFLSEASRRLSGSLELEQVASTIPELVVPRLADFCVLDLLEGDDGQELRRVATKHRDPDRQAQVDALVRFGPQEARATGAARTLRTGEPELVPTVTDEWLRSVSQNSAHLEALRALAPRSILLLPLRSRGRTIGALTCVFDGSGRRHRTENLPLALDLADRAGLALDNAGLFRRSQQAVRTRDEVLRIVAHDLRNPLNAISLSAQLVLDQLPEDGPRKHLLLIRRSVERASRLIQDLLDVAKLQGGTLAIERRPDDSTTLVRQVIDLQHPQAVEHSIELEGVVSGDPGPISADRDRLLQVFANLIGNAIKFTPPGGRITVRARRVGREICFSVSDTGPGIPPESVSHVFEAFWRARPGVVEGAGLGLAISSGIIEAHGGRIWVESEPGRGATFYFTLPVADGGG